MPPEPNHQIDLDDALSGLLGQGRPTSEEEVSEILAVGDARAAAQIERTFGDEGWYERAALPFEPPTVPVDAPPPAVAPAVEATRRLWLARYNPAAVNWDDPTRPDYVNDIENDAHFPWQSPEIAPTEGWWLSSTATPANRYAIAELTVGDLVVLQRTDPGPGRRKPAETFSSSMLVGLAAVLLVDSWTDTATSRREHRACLVPMAKFTDPVPVPTAKRDDRLKGKSFSQPQQLPGRRGPLGFTLSAVEWEDAADILAVCGVHPSILAEASLAKAAARLRSTPTGNRRLLKLRYDHVFRNNVRRQHERQGVRRARAWAARNHYVERQDFQEEDGAGFDLLFVDLAGGELQLEIKGYRSKNLADVSLQPSQEARAESCAAGDPPEWRLFALLGAGGRGAMERLVSAVEAVALIATGGLKVKRRVTKDLSV